MKIMKTENEINFLFHFKMSEQKITFADLGKYILVFFFFIIVWVGFFGIINSIVAYILITYAKDSTIAALIIYAIITLIGLFLIYSTDSIQYLI